MPHEAAGEGGACDSNPVVSPPGTPFGGSSGEPSASLPLNRIGSRWSEKAGKSPRFAGIAFRIGQRLAEGFAEPPARSQASPILPSGRTQSSSSSILQPVRIQESGRLGQGGRILHRPPAGRPRHPGGRARGKHTVRRSPRASTAPHPVGDHPRRNAPRTRVHALPEPLRGRYVIVDEFPPARCGRHPTRE